MNPAKYKKLQIFLLPFSWLYGFAIGLRDFFYDHGWIRAERLPVPVVSVGNLSAGGTGKTPIVLFLAQLYHSHGRQVGILTRGYGRKSSEPQIVENYEKITPEQVGDEPFLLLNELKKVGLAVDKKRERGAQLLLKKMRPDVFILDDGFQYRRLVRDLEIVVLDATRPFDNRFLIPAGLLREPPAALKRASLIWLTRVNRATNLEQTLRDIRRISEKPVIQSIHAPVEFRSVDGKKRLSTESFFGKEVVAFCAIGQPESFRQDLENLGVRLKAFRPFADHHRYTAEDVAKLKNLADRENAEYILCTEKDAVKLPAGESRFWFLKISIQIVANRQILLDLLPALV